MSIAAHLVVMGRSVERRPVDLAATLRFDDRPRDILIENLSETGFGADTDADLQPGDLVIIGAPALHLREARVVWVDGQQAGFEFVRPLRAIDVAEARAIDTVVPIKGTAPSAVPASAIEPAPESPEPVVEKWPRQTRGLILLGGVVVSWAAIWALIRLL